MMTLTQQIITIAAVVLATMVTRFLPFLVFPSGKPTPKYIRYLGKVLPAAVFGLLIAYCLKNASIFRQIDGRVLHFCEYSAIMIYNDSMYQKSQFLYIPM